METEKTRHAGGIYNFFKGATIKNLIIKGNINQMAVGNNNTLNNNPKREE